MSEEKTKFTPLPPSVISLWDKTWEDLDRKVEFVEHVTGNITKEMVEQMTDLMRKNRVKPFVIREREYYKLSTVDGTRLVLTGQPD